MLVTAILLSFAQEGAWSAPSLDELLAVAGVRRVEAPPETSGPTDRLRVPGLADIAWRSVDSSIEFEALSFAAPHLIRTEENGPPPPIDWAARVPGPVFLGPEPVLHLTADASGSFARGRLTLVPAPYDRENGERRLLGMRAGCSMTCSTDFPISLTDEPIELEFELELNSPVNLTGMIFLLETDFGAVPTFVVRVEDPSPLVEWPRVLPVGAGEAAAFEVRASRAGSSVELLDVRHPACVRLERRETLPDGAGARLAFVPTELARAFHACGVIAMRASVDGDVAALERYVDVRHTDPVRDPQGRRVVYYPVMEGESVALWSRGDDASRETHLLFTDRLPCTSGALRALGFRLVASATIPNPATTVDVIVGKGEGSLRLRGLVSARIAESFGGWAIACED